MDEFNSRMDVQLTILDTVNCSRPWREELCGLSLKAIDRWVIANQIDRDGQLATQLIALASKLAFLATKSQEQVSGDYFKLSSEITILTDELVSLLSEITTNCTN